MSLFLTFNILIAVGFLVLWVVHKVFHCSPGQQLRLHLLVLLGVAVVTVLQPLLPAPDLFPPAAQVWSASHINDFKPASMPVMSLPISSQKISVSSAAHGQALLIGVLLAAGLVSLGRGLLFLRRMLRKSFLIRKLGRIYIYVSPQLHVPMSYWLPLHNFVILPESLLNQRKNFRLSIQHELQHHRQGDTRSTYFLWLLGTLCVLNPLAHIWRRWIAQIQEFACDEALLGRRKVESQAYARCLLEVAETAVMQKQLPVCATGLLFLHDRTTLQRRIQSMFHKNKPTGWVKLSAMALSVLSALLVASYGAKGLVQDRRIDMAQAQKMLQRAQTDSDFPIVLNELVLAQLNRYLGTPEGREQVRRALDCMKNYQAMVESKIRSVNAPMELLAVPLIESGYQNLKQRGKMKSAGLWQFIPTTARKFGLTVEGDTDDRMIEEKATEAAILYLLKNKLRFGDWQLSLMAYNMGEGNLQVGMDKLNTRDAFTLIRNGVEGDAGYLAKFMAAVLLLKNPEIVQ